MFTELGFQSLINNLSPCFICFIKDILDDQREIFLKVLASKKKREKQLPTGPEDITLLVFLSRVTVYQTLKIRNLGNIIPGLKNLLSSKTDPKDS